MNRLIRIVFISVLLTPIVSAKPLTPDQVPEPLKPWIHWVLRDQPDRNCPFLYNQFEQKRCAWPTELSLDLTPHKGRFLIKGVVYQDSWVSIPGSAKQWPFNVTVDNKNALVMDRNGVPSIRLTSGQGQPVQYQITGDFLWDTIPDNLMIPSDSGLIKLSLNGVAIPNPTIKAGQIWLKESETGQRKSENIQNSVDIQVFRKIIDQVPLQVLTRLVLDVSGEPHEIKLEKPVLDDFIPVSLQSPLPARFESDGGILLQVRPGRWQIDLLTRTVKELNAIPFLIEGRHQAIVSAPQQQRWPVSEIWVFDAHPELQVVEIEQVQPVDPSQTNLPDDWKALPAYKIEQGQTMVFKKIRRGDPVPEPNQLTLNRKLWLDFDGKGYTIQDRMTGTMSRDWRLDALPQTRLGRVTLDGNNQLITHPKSSDKQGVEVRKGSVLLVADSRATGPVGQISAVGWEQNFHKVSAELNLPPGWRLLATNGVDNVPDSWISRWTLLDLFIVLIASLATSQLWSHSLGMFVLVTLALTWHEPGAPHYIWLNILAATAMIKVLPEGRFLKLMKGYRWASWLALVLIAIPFMMDEIRIGLYPQLEKPWQSIIAPQPPVAEVMSSAPETAFVMEEETAGQSVPRAKARSYAGDAMYKSTYPADIDTQFNRIDPGAKVQTGPGLPQWQWNRIRLSWNGSVDASQQMDFWYLSPAINGMLNFVRVGLIAVLALVMFGVTEKVKFNFRSAKPMLIWLLFVPMLTLPHKKAYAEFPDQAMLEALKNAMLEAPDCLPGCAQIPLINLEVTDKELKITLETQAEQSVAVPLPTDYEQWFPNRIVVDGEDVSGLYRSDRTLWIHLTKGRHQVVMKGVTPLVNKFTLPLPMRPGRVAFSGSGWRIAGIEENGIAGNQLQFIRVRSNQEIEGRERLAPGVLPPFVRVERTLRLGLDWKVATRIIRVSPATSPVLLAVPLLPSESVTTSGIRVKNGKVDVNMAQQQPQLMWESVLEKSDSFELSALQTDHWTEVWKVEISPIWHLEYEGIPMIHMTNEKNWSPEWHPWPGEKVLLKISRPEAAKGQTVTIDNSHLSTKPGIRGQESELTLSLRSSQGGQHTLMLPERSELQSVAIDGRIQPIRQEGRKITFPLRPGEQSISVDWQEPKAISGILSTPLIDVGQGSVNSSLNIALGQDRWVLWVWGPSMGPAVLFWGVLIVIALLSAGLAKIPLTPLTYWQWFLLLVGLSQIPIAMTLVVTVWLMLLGWRSEKSERDIHFFNLFQVMLGFLSLLSLSVLFFAVSQGLLNLPEMQITGNRSTAYSLNWYQDISPSTLPIVTVISVPILIYRLLMLAWSLWLAVSLLRWLKWGWSCYASNGLWKKKAIDKIPVAEANGK